MKPWEPADPDAVRVAYAQGTTAATLAARAGVALATVTAFLRRQGIAVRRGGVPGPRHGLCECGRMVRSLHTPPWGCIRCSEDRAQETASAARSQP